MTRIKLCGLSHPIDIQTANQLRPDYIGFVFAPGSKRRVTPEQAKELKVLLDPGICTVGVFVNEAPQQVAELLNSGLLDMAQLHGTEDPAYLRQLRSLTQKPLIQAFQVKTAEDVSKAERSTAEYVLLDSGAGTGTSFDWELIRQVKRPYFLAGGLDSANVAEAIRQLHPFGVDVSSGIETQGRKDPQKMAAFVAAVRKEE